MLLGQKSSVHREACFPQWHGHTAYGYCDLETESAHWVESVKSKNLQKKCLTCSVGKCSEFIYIQMVKRNSERKGWFKYYVITFWLCSHPYRNYFVIQQIGAQVYPNYFNFKKTLTKKCFIKITCFLPCLCLAIFYPLIAV